MTSRMRGTFFSCLTPIGSAGFTPTPLWHRGADVRDVVGLRVHDGQTCAPFYICDESRKEFWVVRETHFVCTLEQQTHPARTLSLGQVPADMFHDHGMMPATFPTIGGGSAEYFGNELRHDLGVVRIHVSKEGTNQRVLGNTLIEHRRQALERPLAADPLIQSWNYLVAHSSYMRFTPGCW